MQKWVIGIDEAGRGPLAGPVAVGVVLVPRDFNWGLIPGVGDSKKIAPKNREAIFRRARQLHAEGELSFSVGMTPARMIDRIGIVPAITKAIDGALSRSLKRVGAHPHEIEVRLDGGLRAPATYSYQHTIIKGDSTEKVIGLASIMAKVTRDRYMSTLHSCPLLTRYGFEVHKGYGTKKHREAIQQFGLSEEHRRSFCKNIRHL